MPIDVISIVVYWIAEVVKVQLEMDSYILYLLNTCSGQSLMQGVVCLFPREENCCQICFRVLTTLLNMSTRCHEKSLVMLHKFLISQALKQKEVCPFSVISRVIASSAFPRLA